MVGEWFLPKTCSMSSSTQGSATSGQSSTRLRSRRRLFKRGRYTFRSTHEPLWDDPLKGDWLIFEKVNLPLCRLKIRPARLALQSTLSVPPYDDRPEQRNVL